MQNIFYTNEELSVPSDKERFIELIKSIKRENFDADKLINKLENSDFFIAPASTKYHSSFEGGLCKHSLNVYDNLVELVNLKYPVINDVDEETGDVVMKETNPWSEDTLKIVALLHDISKMNLYELTFVNKKVYHENGTKQDNGGAFDWVSVKSYKTKESSDRFIFGNHEMTSEFMTRCFVPLTTEESVAILHHMGGMAFDSSQENMGEIYNAYSLSLLLHTADMFACYIDEKV